MRGSRGDPGAAGGNVAAVGISGRSATHFLFSYRVSTVFLKNTVKSQCPRLRSILTPFNFSTVNFSKAQFGFVFENYFAFYSTKIAA